MPEPSAGGHGLKLQTKTCFTAKTPRPPRKIKIKDGIYQIFQFFSFAVLGALAVK
jgi:hypothetical protein